MAMVHKRDWVVLQLTHEMPTSQATLLHTAPLQAHKICSQSSPTLQQTS